MKLVVHLLILNRYACLLKHRDLHSDRFTCSKLWSGRRDSNPRPTAWKAVTLPLSYSRPKTVISGQ
jgi:hypothetical protein